mmetsp:Transcript_6628/g.10033  ORF Transcript_6628/g.10033 Transcript_6628/m.10033 type:complete len:243 (+) Transcript_6628:24-752(+)
MGPHDKMRSRSFVGAALLLLLCLLSTSPSSVFAQTCEIPLSTPTDQLGPFYIPGSPMGSRVGPESLLSDPTKVLEVTGRILQGSEDCNPSDAVGLAGIVVELWYAGDPDEDGNYYQDDEYRGQVTTDSNGTYSFMQTFPALYPQRPLLHNHFRLSLASTGEELLVTQNYFQGDQVGYFSSTSDVPWQVAEVIIESDGKRKIEFDMYIDLNNDSPRCNLFTSFLQRAFEWLIVLLGIGPICII